MRKTTASGSIRRYFTSGIESYLPIAVMAEKYGLNLRDGNSEVRWDSEKLKYSS